MYFVADPAVFATRIVVAQVSFAKAHLLHRLWPPPTRGHRRRRAEENGEEEEAEVAPEESSTSSSL